MPDLAEGQNLRPFQALQLDFAAHIRHPERNAIPDGIEERRMRIYSRLFYGNIESFCAKSFKRAKEILGDETWHSLIRDFLHRHSSSTPYFCEIQDEFLEFLATELDRKKFPPFILELCHYDWHQLHLLLAAPDVSDRILSEIEVDTELMVSPLVFNLVYEWPVHKLTIQNIPSVKPNTPIHLLVFRDHDHEVHHMEVNSRTALLLSQFESAKSIEQGIEQFSGQFDSELTNEQKVRLRTQARATIDKLASRDVLIAPRD